ncbi:MAG: hypothetical protein ACREQ5_39225 [Candidatus Dormibacteria bacterium]
MNRIVRQVIQRDPHVRLTTAEGHVDLMDGLRTLTREAQRDIPN